RRVLFRSEDLRAQAREAREQRHHPGARVHQRGRRREGGSRGIEVPGARELGARAPAPTRVSFSGHTPVTMPPPRYVVLAGAIAGLAAVLVVLSFRRPQPPVFAPTRPAPAEVGERLVGPLTVTVDASDASAWRFFDFSRGSVVERPGPLDWDLAFRRFHIIANGGPGFAGAGGILALPGAAFDSVRTAPAAGYLQNRVRSDTT